VYAAAPNRGTVRKYAPDLTPVAELRAGLERPVDFHVPFLTLRDHRTDRVERVGRPSGLSVDRWADATGVRLWNLGIEVSGLAAAEADGPAARFTLTDAAEVTVEVADAATGRALARRPAGTMAAGVHTLAVTEADLAAAAGAAEPVLRVSAASRYADGPTAAASMPLDAIPGGARAGRVALLGNSPNPVAGATRIAFALPDAAVGGASLQVYDAMGRLVRGFEPRFRPGVNEVLWDATDQRGRAVPAGVYFARLRAGGQERSHAMVVVW
jgi:hypothetical protein